MACRGKLCSALGLCLWLSACGPAVQGAALVFEPRILDFGQVPAAAVQRTKQVVVRNRGSALAAIFGIDVFDPGARGEQLTFLGVPAELAAGASHELRVELSEASLGARQLQARLRSSAEAEPLEVLYFGTAPSIVPVPAKLDFGVVRVGEVGTATLLLPNHGAAEVKLEAIAFDPFTPGAFTAELSGARRIAPGDTAEIQVRFAPIEEGLAAGGLIPVGAGLSGVRVELEGEGTAAWVVPQPATLDLGRAALGDERVLQVELVSRSTQPRRARVVEVNDGAGAFLFEGPLSSTASFELGPFARVRAAVRFLPNVDALIGGAVVIEDDTGGRSLLTVSGVGVRPSNARVLSDVSALDFGPIPLGRTATLSFRLENRGDGGIRLEEPLRVEPATAELWLSTPRPLPGIDPRDTVRVDVHYRPSALRVLSGAVKVSLVGAPPIFVELSGRGEEGPFPRLWMPPLAAGGVGSEARAVTREVPVINLGALPLHLEPPGVIDLRGGQANVRRYPAQLLPGERGAIELELLPDRGVIMELRLVVASDDPWQRVAETTLTMSAQAEVGVIVCATATTASVALDLHLLSPGGRPFDAPGTLDRCSLEQPGSIVFGRSCFEFSSGLVVPSMVSVTRGAGAGAPEIQLTINSGWVAARRMPAWTRWDVARLTPSTVPLSEPLSSFTDDQCD